jgi:hypothetical protein
VARQSSAATGNGDKQPTESVALQFLQRYCVETHPRQPLNVSLDLVRFVALQTSSRKRNLRHVCTRCLVVTITMIAFDNFLNGKFGRFEQQIRNTWKVLKCRAGEGWRSVGPIM